MPPERMTNEELREKAIQVLEGHKKLVWPEIQSYLKNPPLPKLFEIPHQYQQEERFHWEVSSAYPRRKGKYLRPALLMLTTQAMGENRGKALKTAAAMQVSEDWLLIHDDFEDHSTERRGGPTLHRIYGDEQAVNAGDTLHLIMWKILADNHHLLGYQKTYSLIDEFYTILSRTALGQTVEIRWAQEGKQDFTDNDWFFIADGKTAYYTISGPLRLGAIIADASPSQLAALTRFGLKLGRCFQLVDDVLDLTSNFAGQKKQVGNDIYEGKRTVPLGHLLRNAQHQDLKRLQKILAKPREKKTSAEVAWVINEMKNYGSLEHARKLAKGLRDEALAIFETELDFLSQSSARQKLLTLTHFILEREY